jgi:hypothetical protein
MKLKKYGDNILFFEFKTQKEMALTFFRVQEFYESKNENLVNRSFSVFDFLEEGLDNLGIIDYFYSWSGFNIPGHVFKSWIDFEHGPNYFTHLEYDLIRNVIDNVDIHDEFYIIAAKKKDLITLHHELAHALYYTDLWYRSNMKMITNEFKLEHKKHYKKLRKELSKMGYNEKVIDDEVQAYLSTESKKDLERDFKVDYSVFKPYVLRYRKILNHAFVNLPGYSEIE